MNRFIFSAALLAFSTTALADLNINRSELGSWTKVSYGAGYPANSAQPDRKVDTAAKSLKVNQLTIPQTLKDVRKQQIDSTRHSI